MSTAILIDGNYFVERYGAIYKDISEQTPERMARNLFTMALAHLEDKKEQQKRSLFRIFFYDCPPVLNTVINPINKQPVNFDAERRLAFHDELKKLRKLAMRPGRLQELGWLMKDNDPKNLEYVTVPRGVGIKMGLDIASIAYKRLVDQLVLVAGDPDFVAAAKLARREGLDFILDPMWKPVSSSLQEHVDGLRSTCPRP